MALTEDRDETMAPYRKPPSLVECRFHVVCPECNETLETCFTRRFDACEYARRVAHEHLHTRYLYVYDLMGPKRRRNYPDLIPTAQQEAAPCGQ